MGRPGLPPNNLKELIALMKKERLKEALPGFGTTGHLTSALFAQEAKVQIDFIPYRGATPAMNDLLGDHVDLFVGTPQSIMAFVQAGKLKAYGITSKEKWPQLPTAESMVDELGPKFEIVYWQAMFAPAGTPARGDQDAQCRAAGSGVRSGHPQDLDGRGLLGVPEEPALARSGRGIHEERDRTLGQGHQRQQYSGGAVARVTFSGCSTCSSQSHM